jgi:hypothetical protein
MGEGQDCVTGSVVVGHLTGLKIPWWHTHCGPIHVISLQPLAAQPLGGMDPTITINRINKRSEKVSALQRKHTLAGICSPLAA